MFHGPQMVMASQITTGGVAWGAVSVSVQIFALAWVEE